MLRLLLVGCLFVVSALVVPAAQADKTTTVTIDFSAVGATSGALDPLFFKHDGIRFADTYALDSVQGDAALIFPFPISRPFAATFTPPVTGISVTFALIGPDVVGATGQYTLVARSGSGDVVATKTVTVTQTGTGDIPAGFFSIAVSDLPSNAKSFSMTGTEPFGVNSISYAYR